MIAARGARCRTDGHASSISSCRNAARPVIFVWPCVNCDRWRAARQRRLMLEHRAISGSRLPWQHLAPRPGATPRPRRLGRCQQFARPRSVAQRAPCSRCRDEVVGLAAFAASTLPPDTVMDAAAHARPAGPAPAPRREHFAAACSADAALSNTAITSSAVNFSLMGACVRRPVPRRCSSRAASPPPPRVSGLRSRR